MPGVGTDNLRRLPAKAPPRQSWRIHSVLRTPLRRCLQPPIGDQDQATRLRHGEPPDYGTLQRELTPVGLSRSHLVQGRADLLGPDSARQLGELLHAGSHLVKQYWVDAVDRGLEP
jgi:hypothetical protein